MADQERFIGYNDLNTPNLRAFNMKAGTSINIAKTKLNFNESKKITDSVISKLKAKPKTYFIRDTELTGFWVKLSSGDPAQATYVVNAKPQGSRKDIQRTIGKVALYKVKEAREIARSWLQKIKAGIDPKAEIKKQHAQSQKLSEAFEQYITDKTSVDAMGERSVINYRNSMKGRLASLMNKQINSITEEEIVYWYKRNAAETPSQTDQDLRHLKAVLTHQVKLRNLESSPAEIVNTLGLRVKLKNKETYLNPEQLGTLLATLPTFRQKDAHTRKQTNLWLFILLTGLREKTIYSLKWSQVTLRDSIWIETTKNGDSYHLPLTPLFNDILEQQREIVDASINPKCEYVFPNISFNGPTNDPKKLLNRLYREAGITERKRRTGEVKPMPFRDHDLRRTFASLADLAKVTHIDVKHLMVHKKRDITEKYMQSQQIKAQENYQRIIELLASFSPIAFYSDEAGESVTHYATPELLRFILFNKGPLSKHPDRKNPEFLLDQSKAFYDNKKNIDWD